MRNELMTGITSAQNAVWDDYALPAVRRWGDTGFTIVELIVVMAIVGILALLAIPSFAYLQERARLAACLGDLRTLDKEVTAYLIDKGTLPATLADIGRGASKDPWGNPYQYQKLAGGLGTPYLDPIGDDLNSDYDLFSMGRDGASSQSLTVGNPTTDDDMVRGNDGAYFGLGADF